MLKKAGQKLLKCYFILTKSEWTRREKLNYGILAKCMAYSSILSTWTSSKVGDDNYFHYGKKVAIWWKMLAAASKETYMRHPEKLVLRPKHWFWNVLGDEEPS